MIIFLLKRAQLLVFQTYVVAIKLVGTILPLVSLVLRMFLHVPLQSMLWLRGITTLLACKKTPIMDRFLVSQRVSLLGKLFLANMTDKSHATHELLAFTPHFSKACDEMRGVSF